MASSVVAYAALAVAVSLEVVGTTALQQSQQFTRPLPTLIMAACYLGAFYFLSVVLKTIPVGIAYAMWSGLGIVLISGVGYVLFRQSLDVPALIGLGLIIAGVIVVNVFSSSMPH
ncbi:MAG: QacE family quaternary ammonium compound efflux SMR transporter [Stappia sp.]|uniref:DMT family transporter n=1 Tax=Stappia sp. TaxID=1870903 RepID=UPI000C547AD3|nr:multidrug efflux SMR transporter [Stappia sp.]MAB00342.1 QacE family quaternary ammonium compound efflux SMR transporter [Stappia sp.]MBM18932.1 QacE family quaternary ammonium compound efflux SMR transporter [Stappia sp.]|tara:strand:+ start:349 stop:693 length:345 start_codon:yes stop_codon:yes gene_type:complete